MVKGSTVSRKMYSETLGKRARVFEATKGLTEPVDQIQLVSKLLDKQNHLFISQCGEE
jgi:hypothetical protein